jgi:hypothetical protein
VRERRKRKWIITINFSYLIECIVFVVVVVNIIIIMEKKDMATI